MVKLRLVVALAMAFFLGLVAPASNVTVVIGCVAAAAVPSLILRGGNAPSWLVVVALGASTVVALEADPVFSGPIVALGLASMLMITGGIWGSVGLRTAPVAILMLAVYHDSATPVWALIAALVAGFALAAYWESGGTARMARNAGLLALAIGLLAIFVAHLLPPRDNPAQALGQHPALQSVLDLDDTTDVQSRLLFLVESERPDRWRIQVFSRFDGRFWAPAGFNPIITTDRDHESTVRELVKVFDYDGHLIPARPTPFLAESEYVNAVVDADGSVFSTSRLEPGIEIAVTGWERPTTPDGLRASDRLTIELPALIAPMAEPTETTTERTVAAAQEAVADSTNNFDRVMALENYLRDKVRLSDGSKPPNSDRDRVDWLLFDAGHGRAGQINSALVVLARAVGIPARLVAGFEPVISDSRSGDWMLFEENVELWAEIWFPGSGWVPFDPASTATPRSDDPSATTFLFVVLGVLGIAVMIALFVWLKGWRRQPPTPPEDQRRRPAISRFEDLARGYHIDVSPPSTLLEIGAALAETEVGQTEIGHVGRLLDRDRFGTPRLTDAEWNDVERILDEAAAIAHRSHDGAWSAP